jgi:hypothetical protein
MASRIQKNFKNLREYIWPQFIETSKGLKVDQMQTAAQDRAALKSTQQMIGEGSHNWLWLIRNGRQLNSVSWPQKEEVPKCTQEQFGGL